MSKTHRRRSGGIVFVAAVALAASVLAACQPAPTKIEAHGGTGQIWLTTDPNVSVSLYDVHGTRMNLLELGPDGKPHAVTSKTTDANGTLVLRYITPGSGYTVRRNDTSSVLPSDPITVTAVSQNPPQSFYANQKIGAGYGYLNTRDGTSLSINVQLPGPPEKGPYPTVIEYSGYDPSSPNPSLVAVSEILAHALGFATVGINIRGSGCSGGSFQLWEDAQLTDGYDAVETIAAQPWVLDHKVGMVGISYPATSMMYVGGLQPPHLEALAPMATYDDGFRALLWPGGVQNSGFARQWIEDRYHEAAGPVDDWVKARIAGGDIICKNNMRFRGQNLDLSKQIDNRPFFPTELGIGDSFVVANYAKKVKVPTFLVASWQDEQVGGHAPTMVSALAKNPDTYISLLNGNHTEGLAVPLTIQRWLDFLQLYVGHRKPDTSVLKTIHPGVVGQIINASVSASDVPMPPDPYAAQSSYAAALASFRTQPRVRLLFDVGGAPGQSPGMPDPGFVSYASAYPVPGTVPTTWYLGADHTLTPTAPTAADDSAGATDTYVSDPSVRPANDLPSGSTWDKLPSYDWAQPVSGKSLSYLTSPLTQNTVMVGSGSLDVWLRSSAADTDLQATISEVRPDGKETLVQTGWLRASKRKLDDAASTVLQPIQTQLESDAAPLPAGAFTKVRLEIYPFGHAFRAGSRVRITISAPGGDRSVWAFVNLAGTQTNDIARSIGRPSAVVLPVVPSISIPTPLPACPALRGQPCRDFVAPS